MNIYLKVKSYLLNTKNTYKFSESDIATYKNTLSAMSLSKSEIGPRPYNALVKALSILSQSNYRFTFKYMITSIKRILIDLNSKTFSFGFLYIRGLVFILFIDACLTDDEPL